MNRKRTALNLLVKKRKATRMKGYGCIADYQEGAYECNFISPYTKSAQNLNSRLMVILQDWSSSEAIGPELDLDSVKYGHGTTLPTNKNLKALLKKHFGFELKDIYATNLFPFIKKGGLGKTIPRKDLVEAAEMFTVPEIEIIGPQLVVCLGLATFNALREAHNLKPKGNMAEAIHSPFDLGAARVCCQAHTGGQGQAMRNCGKNRVRADWKRMAKRFLTQ
jgi:hypothetical protein